MSKSIRNAIYRSSGGVNNFINPLQLIMKFLSAPVSIIVYRAFTLPERNLVLFLHTAHSAFTVLWVIHDLHQTQSQKWFDENEMLENKEMEAYMCWSFWKKELWWINKEPEGCSCGVAASVPSGAHTLAGYPLSEALAKVLAPTQSDLFYKKHDLFLLKRKRIGVKPSKLFL